MISKTLQTGAEGVQRDSEGVQGDAEGVQRDAEGVQGVSGRLQAAIITHQDLKGTHICIPQPLPKSRERHSNDQAAAA